MISMTLLKIGFTAVLVFFVFLFLDTVNGKSTSPSWISIPGGLAVVTAIACLVAGGIFAIWGL